MAPCSLAPTRGLVATAATFSPDGSRLLVASGGALVLLDADTGEPVGDGAGVIDVGGAKAMHPDWSPRGDRVAMALCDEVNGEQAAGCSIATVRVDGDVFSGSQGRGDSGARLLRRRQQWSPSLFA